MSDPAKAEPPRHDKAARRKQPKADAEARAERKRQMKAERQRRATDGADAGSGEPIELLLDRIEKALSRQSKLTRELLVQVEAMASAPPDAV